MTTTLRSPASCGLRNAAVTAPAPAACTKPSVAGPASGAPPPVAPPPCAVLPPPPVEPPPVEPPPAPASGAPPSGVGCPDEHAHTRSSGIARRTPSHAMRAHDDVHRARTRSRAPPHLRHHQPPRRRQDDPHREAVALRRSHSPRRQRESPPRPPPRHQRLDGAREGARHLGHQLGAAV